MFSAGQGGGKNCTPTVCQVQETSDIYKKAARTFLHLQCVSIVISNKSSKRPDVKTIW